MLNKEQYEDIFRQYQLVHRHLAEQTIDWYPIGGSEIIVVLCNGDKICYNCLDDGLRNAYNKGSYKNELEEEEAWILEFSFRLKRFMWIRGFTQKSLSEATGISQSVISKYMNRKSLPNIYNINQIARVLNCQISDLTEFE